MFYFHMQSHLIENWLSLVLILCSEHDFAMCISPPLDADLELMGQHPVVVSWDDALLQDQHIGISTYKPDPVVQGIHSQTTILSD